MLRTKMKKITYIVAAVIILVLEDQYAVSGQSLWSGGANVCNRVYSYNTYYTAASQRVSYDNYQTCCKKVWGLCWNRCTRYRKRMVTYYVSRLTVNYRTSYYCCSGYARRGNECPIAICRPSCQNGDCIAPNRCNCKPGFSGKYCQIDIDECLKSPCQQICRNLKGTYACSCRRGFRKLNSSPTDGRCQNINECAASSRLCNCAVAKANCNAKCVDTLGSYKCQCSSGYQLVRNKICTDIDECRSGGHGCQHKCINELGGYKCACSPGYLLKEDKKSCQDINECRRSNGGCEHICSNVVGSYKCSCKSGYVLGYDKARCVDVNECLRQKPCDPSNGICENLPGTYSCKCKAGYALSGENKCQDVNECEGSNKCDHVCHNSVGSYYCSCKKGFVLAADKQQCIDLDECEYSRHECDQLCENMVGSYRCECKHGFRLQTDKKTCRAIQCKKLENPRNGVLRCTGFTYGKKCTYTCSVGYKIVGNKERSCQVTSRWTGDTARCYPKPCPKIRPPLNGILELPCFEEYDSTCTVKCKKGFLLEGNENFRCGIADGNVKWINNNATCKELKACQPNPCKNDGVCRLKPPSGYKCNCANTGYEGDDCEIGVVTMPAYPPLIYGKSSGWIEIRAKPGKELIITPQAVNGDILFTPKRVQLRAPMAKGKLKVVPRSSGLIRIQYALSGASAKQFSPIPDTFVFIAPVDKVGKINQMPDENYISKQCYKMKLDQCSNGKQIEMLSSCPWTSSGTLGYQSVSVGKLRLPLSLGGINVPASGMSSFMYTRKGSLSVSKELNSVIKTGPKFCSAKDSCTNTINTAGEHRFLITQNIFARSYLKSLGILLPKWLNIDVQYGYKGFHLNNVQSLLLKSYNIKHLKICQNIPSKIEPAVYAVQLLFLPLDVKAHAFKTAVTSSSPTCVMTEICRKATYVSLPRDKSISITSELKSSGVKSMELEVHGFGFGKSSPIKRECIKLHDGSKDCFDCNLWLKVSSSIRKSSVKVSIEGEAFLLSNSLDNAAVDWLTKPVKYLFKGELKASVSVGAGGKFITFDINDKDCMAYGAFGLPSSAYGENKYYGLNLNSQAQVSIMHGSSLVSFHPEFPRGGFKMRLLYGILGGKVDGIQNKARPLALLRRLSISVPRYLSSILRTMRMHRSVIQKEYEVLINFQRKGKPMLDNILKTVSSFTAEYSKVYDSLLSLLSFAKSGNDIAELLLTRLSYLSIRSSAKRAITSQLKILKRSLQRATMLELTPKSSRVTENYSGLMIQYTGKLCFESLCFENLDVSINDANVSSKDLLISATFRKDQTIAGQFDVTKGSQLQGRISKSKDVYNVNVTVNTRLFGSNVSAVLEIDNSKTRFVLPGFKLSNAIKFDVEVKAKISIQSNWENTFFTITGLASKGSFISDFIEDEIAEYIASTSELINERHKNATSLVNNIGESLKVMAVDMNIKRKAFMKAELEYEKIKSVYASALTNLNSSQITFRFSRLTDFFKKVEIDLEQQYPFQKCNDTCLSVPVYSICQDPVIVDVNTLACQLVSRKVTTTIEEPYQTKCQITEYRFTPYFTGTCRSGKSGGPSGALGLIGAGVGGMIGGPVGAAIGAIVGWLFGDLFSTPCSESYEVYKEVIHREVDCTLRTFKQVTKEYKEAVCTNKTKAVKSGYDNPTECRGESNNKCVIAQDPVCVQDKIRNIERRRIYVRKQMDSAGKYNDSYERLQDAEKRANSAYTKLIITKKKYLAVKSEFEKIEAKWRQAKLKIKLTNESLSNFKSNFALERCLSRSATVAKPIKVKGVRFETNPQAREDILLKVSTETFLSSNTEEIVFLLNFGDTKVSLRNGAKKVAQETLCSSKVRRRRSLNEGLIAQQHRELFLQHTVIIPQNATKADKLCIVSNTIFRFLQRAFNHLSIKIKGFMTKEKEISSSIKEIKEKISASDDIEAMEQDQLLNSLKTQLESDLKKYTVGRVREDWLNDMEIFTGAMNLTKCLHFTDCIGESFRQLKYLPNIARGDRSIFRSTIDDAEIAYGNVLDSNSLRVIFSAVNNTQKIIRKLISVTAFCSKAPHVMLDKPPQIEAVVGSNLQIRCITESDIQPVKFNWIFNNFTMLSEDSKVLHIKAGYDKQGVYKCLASNPIGRNTSEETLVIVRQKPIIFQQPTDFKFYCSIPKEIVSYFACNVTSDPPATLSWFFQPFQSMSAINLNQSKPVLRIMKPTVSDAGFYHCIAQNPFGIVESRRARLDVLKSRFPNQKVSLSFDMPLGRSGALDKHAIKSKVIADGELSENQSVSVSYEFQSGRDVNVRVSVTDKLNEISQDPEISEIEMLKKLLTFRKKLESSIKKVVNGLKTSRGRSSNDSLEKSMRLSFNGELCGPGYYMHENGFTCLQCPVGYFGNDGKCQPCPIGSYQNEPGQKFCHVCNATEVTRHVGSVNKNLCVEPELQKSDIVFLLDASSSIGRSNWAKVKEFVKKFIDGFVNDHNDLRIGVITYSGLARVMIPLARYRKEELKKKASKLTYNGGLAMTYRGLWVSLNEFRLRHEKGRKKILFVMTAGYSTSSPSTSGFTLSRRVAMQVRQEGVHVISIGVGKAVDPDELKAMASFPKIDNVIQYNSFDQLIVASQKITATSLKGDCIVTLKDISVVVEASNTIADKKWVTVKKFLHELLSKLSSGGNRVALSTFDRQVNVKASFQEISSVSAVNTLMSKVERNKAEEPAPYQDIMENIFNHQFTEQKGSLSPNKILVLMTEKAFDFQLLNDLKRWYPEENVTVLNVIMNFDSDGDDASFWFEEESSFTMANLGRLVSRIEATSPATSECKAIAKE